MLGRIRQATSDFDFTALLSGTKTDDSAATPAAESPPAANLPFEIPGASEPVVESASAPVIEKPVAPEPVAYNPFLVESPVERAAEPQSGMQVEPPRAQAEPEGPIQFDHSFIRSQPALPAAAPLTGPVQPVAQPAAQPARPAPAPVNYARPAASLPAAMTRLTLFLCALLVGGTVGGGLGLILERFTPVRILSIPKVYALPAPVASVDQPPSAPTSKRSTRKHGRAVKAAPAKPATPATVVMTSSPPKALEAYRRYLLIPGGLLLLAGLFWICGGPEALGELEEVGYWGAAAASLALAVLCGLLGVMVLLDLRAASAPQHGAQSAERAVRRASFVQKTT
jgi:hypothetical protein